MRIAVLRIIVTASILVGHLAAAEGPALASDAAATTPAATLAARMIYQQAGRQEGQAATYLREVALGLNAGAIDLAEAERLVALGRHLGLYGGAAVAVAARPDQAAEPVRSGPTTAPDLQSVLDAPAPTARPVAPAGVADAPAVAGSGVERTADEPPPRRSPPELGPALPALAWADEAITGTVKMAHEPLRPDQPYHVLIQHGEGDGFAEGQRFVVRRGDRDLARGLVVDLNAKGDAIGAIAPADWLVGTDERLVRPGDEVVVQARRPLGR